jgi:hypothetical protein
MYVFKVNRCFGGKCARWQIYAINFEAGVLLRILCYPEDGGPVSL